MRNALPYDDSFLCETVVVFLFLVLIVPQFRSVELRISFYNSFFSLPSWFVPYQKISTTQFQLCDLSIVLDSEVKTLKFVIKCFQFIERGIKYYLKR